MTRLSVILCTHNPRPDLLRETLEALRAQTLDKGLWELLLIDNHSQPPLGGRFDLTWHSSARCVVELDLGLTPARLRGIREAESDLLVFVDDDNLLAPDYLENALRIANDKPVIGAFGGNISPRFESPPPAQIAPYMFLLATRDVPMDVWSNLYFQYDTVPIGAGMCVRREVALAYAENLTRNPVRVEMDRKGDVLAGCGDLDLALTACDLGLGTGLFACLKMTHIIPARRFEIRYLLGLMEGGERSGIFLDYFRGRYPARHLALLEWLKSLAAWRKGHLAWRFRSAKRRGRIAGARLLKQLRRHRAKNPDQRIPDMLAPSP